MKQLRGDGASLGWTTWRVRVTARLSADPQVGRSPESDAYRSANGWMKHGVDAAVAALVATLAATLAVSPSGCIAAAESMATAPSPVAAAKSQSDREQDLDDPRVAVGGGDVHRGSFG